MEKMVKTSRGGLRRHRVCVQLLISENEKAEFKARAEAKGVPFVSWLVEAARNELERSQATHEGEVTR